MAAEERKRKRDIEKILKKLTEEQREFLAELDVEERARIFKFFSHYTSEELEILRKVRQKELVSEEQMEFAYRIGIEAIEEIEPIFYDIVLKLPREEIEMLLLAAIKYPNSFVYKPAKPKPPVPTPELPPPTPPEITMPERPAEMKRYPWKWRSQFPFQTSTFIRQFLAMRGNKGAYPYEVYKAYKITLWKIITDPAFREQIIEHKGITFAGEMIDGKLSEQIERDTTNLIKACPGVHIATYTNFWKYFMVLNFLELIKKKGKKKKSEKSIFDRQLYVLNKKIEKLNPKLWDVGWQRPQEIAYPLAGLGKYRYNELKKEAEERGITIQEALVDRLVELEELAFIAEIRNLPETELAEQIIKSSYFKK